jgi:hypothetical protein
LKQHRVNAIEVALFLQGVSQAPLQFLHNLIGVALEQLGAILGEFRHGRLRRIPVAGGVLVQVGRRRSESSQRITEHGRGFTRHHTTELYTPIFDAPVGSGRRRRGTQLDGSGHAPAGGELAKVRHLAIEPQWQRVGSIHVLL